MDVFSVFTSTPYTFLKVSRGGVYGNVIQSQTTAQGIFKLRDGMEATQTSENRQSTATLHIRPTEAFISDVGNELVGHGIRKDGKDYEILGVTGGMNYHNGSMEHYTLTLDRTDYAEYAGS